MSKIIISRQLDGLLRGDEQDVDSGASVHTKVSLSLVRLPEAVKHTRVHLLSIRANLKTKMVIIILLVAELTIVFSCIEMRYNQLD